MVLLIVFLYLIFKIGLSKVFQKAGRHAFLAFIPIVDLWVWIELSSSSGVIILGPVLLFFLYQCIMTFPFLGMFLICPALIIAILLLGHWFQIHFIIARRFGGGVIMGVLLVFLPFLMIPILGFSSCSFVSSIQ